MNTEFEVIEHNQYGLKVGSKGGICPLCSHTRTDKNKKTDCASYDWERGLGTCHHCGEVFQLHKQRRKTIKQYVRPEVKGSYKLSSNLITWFLGRGITKKTLERMRITESKQYMPQAERSRNVIGFNYFEHGDLINTKFRDAKKNFKLIKGAELIFYNIDGIIGRDEAIIVEGEMDVLTFVECGTTNVVSVPNGASIRNNNLESLNNCYEYFQDKKKIILALDNDEPGRALQTELIRRFGPDKCYLVDFEDCKDANEYFLSHGKDSLALALLNAKPPPLTHVKTLHDIDEEFTDFVENGFKPGFITGMDNFDRIFSTYTSQFITVTGIPSSGKSDFVDQMAVGYNLKYNWKVAYASPENLPFVQHAHKLFRKMFRGMPNKQDLSSKEGMRVKERLGDYFFFLDFEEGYNIDKVLEKGAELVRRKGIKLLVIDPYNKIRLKIQKDVHVTELTLEYLTKIDIFCKRYDVLVILVAHPIKMPKDKVTGEFIMPDFYKVKGGGEFYDASYHGLVVHRNYKEGTTTVKVLKVKFQNLGTNGASCEFTWDKDSGIFTPIEESKKVIIPEDDLPF